MPKTEENGLPLTNGFISCVEFLLYQHMQRLVWRLTHKWGINWRWERLFPSDETNLGEKSELLNIYTEKKANAWQKIRFIYQNELYEFLEGQSERIRRKFGFCLMLDGKMRLKCEPIKRGEAFFLIKNFHKIPIYEPKFERNKGQMVENMAINLFNSLKLEHIKSEEEKISENILENERKIDEMKRWRSAEKVMKERLKVLDDLKKMNDQLNGDQNANDDDDTFKKCANVVDEDGEAPMFNEDVYGKSFDQHLMQCIGQFLESVANDQFKYHLFVNFYTKQLDSEIEFPDQMAHKFVPFTKDKCHFMREVLASLNKSVTYRLNFEKITKRSEKEKWVELHEQLEDVLMRRQDKSWADRKRRKVHRNAENLRQTFQKWNAMANPIKHPIRDEYRKMRELIRGKVIRSSSPKRGGGGGKAKEKEGGRRRKRKTSQMETTAEEGEEAEVNENSGANSTNDQKIDQKIIKIVDKIEKHPLSKRFEVYEKFYKAFNVALALELFGRYENGGTINWQFIFGDETAQLVPINDQLNFQKIKSPENLKIFDEIAKRMGNKLKKGHLKYLIKKRTKNYKTENEMEKEENNKGEIGQKEKKLNAIKEEEEKEEEEEEEKMGKGGKSSEIMEENKEIWTNSSEIMEERNGVKEESWDKEKEHERAKAADDENHFEIEQFVGDEQQREEDKGIGIGFELAHLGYLNERDGGELLDAFVEEMKLNMDQFGISWDSDCDMSDDLNQCLMAADGLDFDEQLLRFSLLGKQRDEMGTLERAVESLFKTLNRLSYKLGQKSKSRQSFLARFYYVNIYGINEGLVRLMSGQMSPFELFIPFYMRLKKGTKFVVKKVVATSIGHAFRAWTLKLFNSLNATLKGEEKNIRREMKNAKRRKKREAFEKGAAITAHIRHGKMGSSTVRSIMFNSRIVDSAIPGLHLHWLHANAALLLGKYSLLGHLPSALLFSLVIVSVLFWWHAAKLAVYLAMLYGDLAGWALLLIATALFIGFCIFLI
ncbi:hypothetical protein niasHT_038424 [Heterodera trifolii]|uniref:Uncharacterized protein n=1 Tax=Heterodera trifolii TaxID=157864 RepID=A0ABD2IP95_9BILA